MIIVTGANGQLGRAIVEHLLELVPAQQIGVSVREIEKAQDFEKRGVRVRHGDFTDPTSLTNSFEGAAQVLIISSNSIGGETVRQHRTAIDAAKAVGAERILYTSHMGSNPTSHFHPMRDHAATEDVLRESGMAFTSLRNGYYASSVMWLLGNALETGELAIPEDGPVSWTAHADLAKAAAVILAQGGVDAISPDLTAPEALDMAGVAEIASELTGRTIRHVVVSDDEFRSRLVAHGTPAPAANMILGIYAASRDGEFANVDPMLAHLIGGTPLTVHDVLSATLQKAHRV